MLRMNPVGKGKGGARRADLYYDKTDGGYYAADPGLRCWYGGKGADRLGLAGVTPESGQFRRLVRGLDPWTGEQLTARLRDDRLSGWDVTASVPKGVTTNAEKGDERIPLAIRRAVEAAMRRLETYATTRVRTDGQQTDRLTGNLVWYAVEHPDTRPVEDESLPDGHRWKIMPDPDRHVHVVIFNVTWDDEEHRWKAVKFRPIMDLRKYFDRCFDAELAAELAGLGYSLKTEWKENRQGKMGYYSWDIADVPDTAKAKNSRRSRQEIDRTEADILAGLKDQYGDDAPDRLSAVDRAKLGGTSRRHKRDDLTLEECREYWESRYTTGENDAIAESIRRARLGLNPLPEPRAAEAAGYAMRHHFEKESALPVEELVATALERSIGSARPADIERELSRQGVILVKRDGRRLATTQALQREEERLAAYAADGRGAVAAIGLVEGLTRQCGGKRLNDGQWEAVTGLLQSTNRVNVIEGPAGAGKSSLLKKFEEGATLAGGRVTFLGTTAASVKVLQKDGFKAGTLAGFLLDKKQQEQARGGRCVLDETSMLGHAEAVRLVELAKQLDLKLIFAGDPMQHSAVARGAFLRLLTQYGHIRPFKLREIMRQKNPAYRSAAQSLSEGKAAEGFAALDSLGCVKEIEHGGDRYTHLAADYVQARKDGLAWDDVLVIAPTHRESGFITRKIRQQLRDGGGLGEEETIFTRLVQAETSEAQRGLAETYRVGDVIQFHQNAKGGFVKGQRLTVTDPTTVPLEHAGKFALYRPEEMALSVGDVIRFTGRVQTRDGQHAVRNGDAHAVAEITPGGNIRLDNGWVVDKDCGHFRYGYVETSMGSQGRTVRRALVGMAAAAGRAAINMQQLYVSASRASESVRIYTDDKEAIREDIEKDSRKLLALDLKPARKPALSDAEKRRRRAAREEEERMTRRVYDWTVAEQRRLRTPLRPMPPLNPPPVPTHAARVRESQRPQQGLDL